MRFYKIILIIIIQSSLVMAEEALELKEYQIELIIFKHSNVETDEVFDDSFITPAEDFLNFYEPKLQINKKSFDVKVEENFFNKLFTNLKPLNIRNRIINKEDVSSNISSAFFILRLYALGNSNAPSCQGSPKRSLSHGSSIKNIV